MLRRTRNRTRLLAFGFALTLGTLSGGSGAGAMRTNDGIVAIGFPNVRVSHDGYIAHGQPSVAVNPRNPRNLLGAAMALGEGTLVEETFASLDGGQSWHDNGPLPMPAGVSFGGDPSVVFDARGVGYVASLGEPQTGDGVFVWRTDDGGRSFHPPVAVELSQPADHPWLAVDRSPGSGSGDLYVAWATRDVSGLGHAGGLAFSRSTDGGRSFASPRIISAPASGVSIPAVTAGAGGAVYVAYTTLSHRSAGTTDAHPEAGPPAGVNGEEVQVVSSRDHGHTFSRPTVVGPTTTLLTAAPGVDLTTQPSVTTDPRDGSVYVAFSGYRAGNRRAAVLVARSRDKGRGWDAPVPVTTESGPSPMIYFQPHVVVDDTDAVDVTFFALAHRRVDLMLARSTALRAGFEPLQRITSRSFDPVLGWSGQKTGAWWIGDYQGLAAGGGLLHPFWNDTRTGQLEIYTAAIPVSGR